MRSAKVVEVIVEGMCGELLLIARLNNSPTHKKRPKAYAEPKAAGRGGRQNLHVRPSVGPRR